MENNKKLVALVYQSGIANVFVVDVFQTSPIGRKASRLYQGAFRSCEYFALGMAAMGAIVKSYHCNIAGESGFAHWAEDVENAVFRSEMYPVNTDSPSEIR